MNNMQKHYNYMTKVAVEHGLSQTQLALPYARQKHEGMYRKGPDKEPYIIHPIVMARHAVALGFLEDDLIATAILHDVCEDCGVAVEDLPVNEKVKYSVALLTKKAGFQKKVDNPAYYEAISTDRNASIVKILDRCHNASCMSEAFSATKMRKYARETEEYIYPLIEKTIFNYPDLENALFDMEYQLKSVIRTIYNLLPEENQCKPLRVVDKILMA